MKSVTFEASEHVFYIPGAIKCTYSVTNPGPVTKRWYTKQDFRDFKNQGRMIVLELRRSGLSTLLDAALLDMINEEKIETAEEVAMDTIRVSLVLLHGGISRGLERWVHPEHNIKRVEERRVLIVKVLQRQALRIENSGSCARHADSIRLISESSSSNTRRFARLMGIADEKAVSQERRGAKVVWPNRLSWRSSWHLAIATACHWTGWGARGEDR